MCGICGILALKGQRPDAKTLRRMVTQINHRGPDDSGCEIIGPCGLGNTRLAIIDVSSAGHQPMHVYHKPSRSHAGSEVSDAWIAYNGEAYNFMDVRSVLVAMGHRFTSMSDTETLLRAYLQFGEDNFIKPFRGMFSLAIWDVERQKLILMRDRLGKKPLYYAIHDGWLAFGSEIKTILEHPGIPRRVNQSLIPHYLAYGYAPSPDTLFDGIRSVPPGHMLTVDLSGSEPVISLKCYWAPPYSVVAEDGRSEDDIASELLAHLQWAVRMRLVSDVPLGAFLSGGIDSAAIVALMARESRGAVKTFSIGFAGEQSFDETRYARQISARFVTEHHEFIVEPKVIDLVDELVWHHDQPFGDSSAIPTYLVSKMAREYVTVVLTGDGSDELFAGYDRFQAAVLSGVYEQLPDIAHKAIGGALRYLPESTEYGGLVRSANRFVSAATLPLSERYLSWVRYVPGHWVVGLLNEDAERAVLTHYRSLFGSSSANGADDIVAQLLDVNLRTYLVDDLLVKADRASMAASLEARSPFLDHQLVNFVAGIPASLKLKRGTSKYILKKALRCVLPDKIIDRKKHGFGVPVGAWFRGELESYLRSVLLSERSLSRGIMRGDVLREMIDVHVSAKADLGYALWTLLTFELWMQRYFN
jgi:asparagine synthase (glutamine-hydrolysing)